MTIKKVQNVLQQRCYLSHGAQLQVKNVRLDSPALPRPHAQSCTGTKARNRIVKFE